MLSYKFLNTNRCIVDTVLNGKEAFENVQKKFDSEPS